MEFGKGATFNISGAVTGTSGAGISGGDATATNTRTGTIKGGRSGIDVGALQLDNAGFIISQGPVAGIKADTVSGTNEKTGDIKGVTIGINASKILDLNNAGKIEATGRLGGPVDPIGINADTINNVVNTSDGVITSRGIGINAMTLATIEGVGMSDQSRTITAKGGVRAAF